MLDSNHTHEHVLRELHLYAPYVSFNSYIVVFDTSIEFDDPSKWSGKRTWGVGNSPHSALRQFLASETGSCFEIDNTWDVPLELTACKDGFLKRVVK